MADHLVISLNREYGSGGRELADILSNRLGMPVHDDDIAGMAAEHSGIRKDYFEKVDEKPTDSFLYMLAMNTFSVASSLSPFDNTLSSDKLFNQQSEVIRHLADTEDCIIVGRCGGYILRDYPKCVRIFVCASEDYRINRVMGYEQVDEKEALKSIRQMDRRRDNYFGYYAGEDWKAAGTYDLCVDSSILGLEKAADLICHYLELRFGSLKD